MGGVLATVELCVILSKISRSLDAKSQQKSADLG